MASYSQRTSLAGSCCLISDADSLVGRTLVDHVVATGATAIALRHRPPDPHHVSWRSAAIAQTVSAPVDLRDQVSVRSGIIWAIERCGRLDAAVIADTHGVAAMLALAECALTDLALTARFAPGPLGRLVCLARPQTHAATAIGATSQGIPFADLVDVQIVEAWPDTPLSSIAAVREVLAGTAARTGSRRDISD